MEVNYQYEFVMEIVVGIGVVFLFTIGLYLQAKKIQICLKEDNVSKKLDITNSILLTLHWTYLITLYGVTHVAQNLYVHTGDWFCFMSKILLSIGDAHAMGHSFLLAFLKFLVIVHAESDVTRKEKFKKALFYLNLLYGIVVVGILNVARPDYIFIYHSTLADRCFGRSGAITSQDNTSSAVNLAQLCDISHSTDYITLEYVLNIIRKFICWFDVSFIYLNAANLLEAICYARIFIYMNRKISPSQNRIAADLAESTTAYNMRKLQVNAQITAVISSIEFFFFIAHIVGVSAAGGTNPETGMIVMLMYMVLFMIILPYAFLMNTSFNKNRIIEQGWLNVVKNITTNNSIFWPKIICYSCAENHNNELRNEAFVIGDNVEMAISKQSKHNASIDQAGPSSTGPDEAIQNRDSKKDSYFKFERIADIIFNPESNNWTQSDQQHKNLVMDYGI